MAAPTSLYVDLPLRQMRTSYEALGIHGLANTIQELEKTYAISPNNSRILDSGDYQGNAEFLLAQISPEILTSIFSNTLPADVVAGRVALERWAVISRQPQHKDTLEPGIYANYLAPADGSPLTLAELQRFLHGLEAAVFGRIMNDQTNISQLVDAHHRLHYGNGRTLLHGIRGPNLTAALDTFLQINEGRLRDAQSQNATHITLHGDCGWAINVHDRCKQHRTLVSSPALFRLANCVLQVLFPTKHFEMHHFCLFRAFKTEHAGTGESIGSHLVTSYSTYGGFNFAQAGYSVTKAKELTGNGWMTVCDRYAGLLDVVTTKLDDEYNALVAQAKQEEAEVKRRRRYAALVQQRAEIDGLKRKVADGDKRLDLALVFISGLTKGAELKIAKNKQRIGKRDGIWQALANKLGVSSADDDAHSSAWSGSK